MRKFILIAVVGLVVLVLGVNWYYTREIRQQLDRTASAVSMFGTLSYDNVRLTPGGAIHINGLAFFLRGNEGQGIQVDRVAFRTAGLGALLSLERDLEAGRVPEQLGVAIEGLEFSLGGLPRGVGSRSARARSGQAADSLGFAAAGCQGRSGFSVDDFIDMDYFVIQADVEANYRFVDEGLQLRQYVRTRSAEIGEVEFEAVVDLNAGSLGMMELMTALRRADLNSFTFEYEDLGFYPRMLGFCARRMDMDRDTYIDHHVRAWAEQWARLGSRPAPQLVEAYRRFVESPDRLSATSRAVYSVDLQMLGEYSLAQFFERMETRISFGNREPIAVEARIVETPPQAPDPAVAASAPAPDDPASSDPVDAEPAAPRSEAVRRSPVERARVAGEAASAARSESRWSAVELTDATLADLVDRPVRVDLVSGRRFFGRVERIEPESLHLRFTSDSGYFVRPVARAEIRSIAVRNGVP